MASIGQLVRVVAEWSGLEESAVKLIARYVREAGLIGQKSTGGGAATMTSVDAAALLIAVNGSSLAKDAAGVVKDFISLPFRAEHESTTENYHFKQICGSLSRMESFGSCLAMLIQIAGQDDRLFSRHKRSKQSNVSARIVFERPKLTGSIFLFEQIKEEEAMQLIFGRIFGVSDDAEIIFIDRSIDITITEKTIAAVAETIIT